MGAWVADTFSNDDASDWLAELERADEFGLINKALRRGTRRWWFVDVRDASVAIAAAEVVAALYGKPGNDLPDSVKAFVARVLPPSNRELAELALKAVQRVEAKSELQALWDETDEAKEWHAMLADLAKRLA